MKSRELVHRTLEFKSPLRAPRHMWTLPWAVSRYGEMHDTINRDFPQDIVNAPALLEVQPAVKGDPYQVGEYVDEWGCIFDNKQDGIIGEVKKPLVVGEEWEDFDGVHIPEELLTFDMEAVNRFCAQTEQFVIAGACPRPFERLQFIRGTQELYVDLALDNPGLKKALEQIHDFYCRLLTRWAKTDVDALSFMDDWGAQKSLLINPDMWRTVFRPLYQEYIDIAHSHGKKIFMHSDGNILDIIPKLVDMGLDAINCQLFCMGIDQVAGFAGNITFWGEIDRQWILPYGSRQDVVDAVTSVYEKLWKNGGCIAQCEFGIGANPDNVYTVFETWDQLTNRAQG